MIINNNAVLLTSTWRDRIDITTLIGFLGTEWLDKPLVIRDQLGRDTRPTLKVPNSWINFWGNWSSLGGMTSGCGDLTKPPSLAIIEILRIVPSCPQG